jgi:hypothetical protein
MIYPTSRVEALVYFPCYVKTVLSCRFACKGQLYFAIKRLIRIRIICSFQLECFHVILCKVHPLSFLSTASQTRNFPTLDIFPPLQTKMPSVVTFKLPLPNGKLVELLPGQEIWTRSFEKNEMGPPRWTTLRALFDFVQAFEIRGLSWSFRDDGVFTPIYDLIAVMVDRPWHPLEIQEQKKLRALGIPKERVADIVLEFGCGQMAAKSIPRQMMLEDVLASTEC